MSVPPLDVAKAWPSRELEHGRQLFRARFSPDGRFVAAGGQDKLVHVWDLEKDEKRSLRVKNKVSNSIREEIVDENRIDN